jgi:lipopolysaccharide/colanic/teichoic acid biosynthesis glycosyltransferase
MNKSGYQIRVSMANELAEHLAQELSITGRMVYWRKRILWDLAVKGGTAAKRFLDITVGSIALLVLSPLFFVVSVLIKLEDPAGPIFFSQPRVGRWGREFPFYKFRSMVANAQELKDKLLQTNQHGEDGITFKMKEDPRITRVGRVIRRFSIDELPQLWSVVIGDMSLVGPRPAVPREVANYSFKDRRRLNAAPGLTCIWQVSGRSDIPFPQQVELDEKYIQSSSLITDLKLLVLTIPAVLSGRGAY